MTFGCGLPATTGSRLFVAKFNSGLGCGGWATRGGNLGGVAASGYADGRGIAVYQDPLDASRDACYVTAYFNGTANFGNNVYVTDNKNPGVNDYLIAKLRISDGTPVWAIKGGDDAASADPGSWDETRGIAVDRDGNPYITGFRHPGAPGNVNEGPTVLVASYSSAGYRRWTRNATDVPGGSPEDIGMGIAVDDAGCVHVTGDFNEVLAFGPAGQLVQTPGSPLTARHMFVAKMCPTCCPADAARPVLRYEKVGHTVILSWDGPCCHLESTSDVFGNPAIWSYVGDTSPIAVTLGGPTFFRLACP